MFIHSQRTDKKAPCCSYSWFNRQETRENLNSDGIPSGKLEVLGCNGDLALYQRGRHKNSYMMYQRAQLNGVKHVVEIDLRSDDAERL